MHTRLAARYDDDPNVPDMQNQVLQWKARRDRFGARHGHRPHLCSENSEDMLVWRVFRALERGHSLDRLARWLGIGQIREILYWLFHADRPCSALQSALSHLLLEIDGQMGGQMTEPDVVFFGSGLCFLEAKLGRPCLKPTLWSSPSAKRMGLYEDYLSKNSLTLFKRPLSDAEKRGYYQLFRNVFYTCALGRQFQLEPRVICLVNELNWNAVPARSGSGWDAVHDLSIRQAFEKFKELLRDDESAPFPASSLVLKSWQQLATELELGNESERQVADTLREHPCLRGASRPSVGTTAPKSLSAMAAEMAARVPDEEWRAMPADLSTNLDHYLYGTVKTEPQ